ncbi:MAG: ABC transporter permease [Gammaproteobacteria bacterium HGW-Gammaproteobacteria-10]|nr:MAG: ABC transporter permease [Gammaproteobacteria bacterium HGW-Gammaproteobacteria-10]
MTTNSENPSLTLPKQSGDAIVLTGTWNLRALAKSPRLRRTINELGKTESNRWDLSGVTQLDSTAAFMLWQAWGEKLPVDAVIRPEQQRLFEYWHGHEIPAPKPMELDFGDITHYWLMLLSGFYGHIQAWLTLFGRLILDSAYLLRHPKAVPLAEISRTIFKAGIGALGITALVGFLVGVSMSYLSSLQLQRFGAEIYIIDLLGLSIIRELGPVLTAILIAGRSGSSMTAEIGIMRVTQELDALSAMGISHTMRLVLPKVVALSLVLPLLIVWSDAIALFGGMVSASLALDISFQQFFNQLPKSVPIVNFYIGIGKGFVFGMMIAMIACHFGFLIKPNTESLGKETTRSVVATITVVIMVDTVFSILFREVGMP